MIYIDHEKASEIARLIGKSSAVASGMAMNITAMLAGPDPELWHWECLSCYLRHEKGTHYRIDGNEMPTATRALGWTLYLQEKVWYYGTDWEEFIRSRFAGLDG